MEYRKLPHGAPHESFSVLGLGMGGIQHTPPQEIEAIIRKAIDHGINFFDLCAGGAVYEPFGKAIRGRREQVFLQVHFGAVYDEQGEYGWCRDFETIRKTFLWELETLGTDYVDFGFLHCVDEDEDFDKLCEIGVLDYLKQLKEQGTVRHIGFSSHTPSVANRILDTGLADMMMFSINPAYDFEKGDEYGIGSVRERFELFKRCEREGVGISVMKPFFAGQLLSAEQSPFGEALTHAQCLQYALDRPGVLTTVPGVQTMEHLDTLLTFLSASEEEKDYSRIASFTADTVSGTCVYCNHCQPCPAGIDIGLVNKYYDLALAGDRLAANHYTKLTVDASACLSCGHCESRCPFDVKQESRMQEIKRYFSVDEKETR
ncbi:MAG: (4Fe-4S)-binding protein [Ruminococcaceae bacterium]|nr:(4Fe-4S)-binding protein [Oscillospiraceae bacterium]